jgi:hypothetical protein
MLPGGDSNVYGASLHLQHTEKMFLSWFCLRAASSFWFQRSSTPTM